MSESRSVVSLSDRIRGCLLAGAAGDAMGGPFEGQIGPIESEGYALGEISDDTQLTLATCESIVEAHTVTPEHIASCFLRWFRQGRITGMGASTIKALCDLDAGQHWALAGARGEMAAGNGAAMRVAPLAFVVDPTRAEDRRSLRDICRITHHHEEAYIGGLAVVLAVHGLAFEGVHPPELSSYVTAALPDSRVRDRLGEIGRFPGGPSVLTVGQRFGCSGYVVDSVPLAIYAAQRIATAPLEQVLRDAISAGGDTDTIASIAGQIAGTACGASVLPADLLRELHEMDMILTAVDEFVRVATGARPGAPY